MTCAIGFRVKSGWAAAVLLGGPKSAPHVLDSRIIELSDPDVSHSRQPYHAGIGTAQTNAAKVARLVRGIERFSRASLAALIAEYRKRGRLRGAGVVVPSLTDPATIASPHMRAHANEGRLFRTVVMDGVRRRRLPARFELERDVFERLGRALRRPPSAVKALVTALGDDVEGRWRAEQKTATAAAWLLLTGA
ncbi:MAG: hypothetical protein ACREMC_03975 [Gemmatimonadales bacterium]